jgi:hypothetical protein
MLRSASKAFEYCAFIISYFSFIVKNLNFHKTRFPNSPPFGGAGGGFFLSFPHLGELEGGFSFAFSTFPFSG